MIFVLTGILIVWTALTIWAEYSGGSKVVTIGNNSSFKNVLIVYNPDPIYNLDEQICENFAKGLANENFNVKIATVKVAKKELNHYYLYVFCANTYNWAPDWLVKSYIEKHPHLKDKNAIGITLGSGSTERSQRILEETINSKQAKLLDSKTYWLLKPNDENRMKENNIKVALDMAEKFGTEIGKKINSIE